MTSHHEPVDPDHYRKAIGRLATGVSVVTTRAGDIDHAMTINSLTSVSLDPVLMLISVEREARFFEAVMERGEWAVSLLGASAKPIASWLATRGRPLHGQLDRVPHHRGEVTGVALLDDCLATIECRTADMHPAGDHSIVVGEVVSLSSAEHPDDALLYYRSRYGTLS